MANSHEIIGLVALRDEIRTDAAHVIQGLHKRGIKTIMLTGDNEENAQAIAQELEIDEYYAELLPQHKVSIIQQLKQKYSHIIMVGDGVNDAPALASATVGIAMGAIGSAAAIESADISLMHDDLKKILYLVDLSSKTMAIVKQNVSLSLFVKTSLAVLTFFGLVSLWMAAGIGDMGITFAVILNALRIGIKHRWQKNQL